MQGAEAYVGACLQVALQGEHERGDGGVVFVEDEHIGYVLLHDVQPDAFRERLAEMVEEDERAHYFVVHKDGLNMHVAKIPRIRT